MNPRISTLTQPAHEKIGVIDSQWIVHQTIPSLGNQVGYMLFVFLLNNYDGSSMGIFITFRVCLDFEKLERKKKI